MKKKDQEDAIVTLTSFTDVMEANIVAEKLRVEGIPCFLADEVSYIMTRRNYMNEGIRLQIFEKDIPRARDILGIPSNSTTHEYQNEVCPKCQSKNINRLTGMNAVYHWINAVLFALFLRPSTPIRFRCLDCGKEF
ncbi:DUF2007 domain-containing protein [bacterium]|nr:DUF2007 domain-containing protein [bacterium]